MAFRIRQGLEAARGTIVPALGEPLWTTDTNKLYIGDGSTAGGVPVSSEVDLTTEGLQDIVGAMFVGNAASGITFTYNDSTGKINATVNFPPGTGGSDYHFNITGIDSTLTQINRSETIQFVGQNGITVGVSETPGGVTRVNIDGSAVQGTGGGADLSQVGWYLAGEDSSQNLINNSETVRIQGANGISVSVDDSGGACSVTITAPDVGTVAATNTIFSVPFYNTLTGGANDLVSAGPDMRFSSEAGCFSANILGANTFISQIISTPLAITNIQANTPIAGRATVTFVTHPHPPFYVGRYVKIENANSGSWDGVYEVVSSTTTQVIIITTSSFSYISGGTIRETTNRGINIFPTGEENFLTIGGAIDLNNTLGLTEYGARLRVTNNGGFGALDLGIPNFSLAEFVQIHNDVNANAINLIRGRGTLTSTTSVQNGDMLGALVFTGLDGVNSPLNNFFYPAGSGAIYVSAAETPAAISGQPGIAGRMHIQTAAPGAGYVLSDAIVINEYQTVSILARTEISGTIRISGNQIETIVSNASLDFKTNGSGSINLDADTNVSGTLFVSNVDTDDSSAITVVPSTIFNSDVTVENDLTVNNKVYATEFVSTSVGTPQIVTTSNFNLNVNGNIWTYATNGDLTLPDNSTFGSSLWTAASSSYVGLNSNNGDNSVSVGDNSVIVTTNANTLSRNFYFNLDGGLQLPIRNSAPASPIAGSVYVADGTAWDPDSKGGAYPYPVYYDGNSYNALY